MPFPLETTRLLLRPFHKDDIHAFADYRSDPDVARYQSWEAPFSVAQAAAFVAEMQHVRPGAPGEWLQIAIQLKATNQMIGDCAFCVLEDESQQAEIGFTLARLHHGNGYATEAVRRLLDYLFVELNLHRVRAICDADNLASARLLERIGMRREGHFVENIWFKGHWGSEYSYAVLRREWEESEE